MDLGSNSFIVAILAGVSVFVTTSVCRMNEPAKDGSYAVDTQDDHRASELLADQRALHWLPLPTWKMINAQGKIPEED